MLGGEKQQFSDRVGSVLLTSLCGSLKPARPVAVSEAEGVQGAADTRLSHQVEGSW